MGRITLELLRKRAEHNDGLLSTLEEITLHGQNIEEIEVIGHACRNLKILYLQNNVIAKIQDIHHLKELEYLNLAINNLVRIENLHRCESLQKLDLTMNFIGLEHLDSVDNLKDLSIFRELHLLGNPCTNWEHFRAYVISRLPRLQNLDGQEIKQVEKQEALSKTDWLCNALWKAQENVSIKDNTLHQTERKDLSETSEIRRPWCPETRLAEHREQERLNSQAESARKEAQSQLLNGPEKKHQYRHNFPPLPKANERIAQKNEGGWKYLLRESEDDLNFVLEVYLGNGILTNDIKADVHPKIARILIKGKLLQLELSEEVVPEKTKAQRSKATGNLLITMAKANSKLQSIKSLRETANLCEQSDSSGKLAGRQPPKRVFKSEKPLALISAMETDSDDFPPVLQ